MINPFTLINPLGMMKNRKNLIFNNKMSKYSSFYMLLYFFLTKKLSFWGYIKTRQKHYESKEKASFWYAFLTTLMLKYAIP